MADLLLAAKCLNAMSLKMANGKPFQSAKFRKLKL